MQCFITLLSDTEIVSYNMLITELNMEDCILPELISRSSLLSDTVFHGTMTPTDTHLHHTYSHMLCAATIIRNIFNQRENTTHGNIRFLHANKAYRIPLREGVEERKETKH